MRRTGYTSALAFEPDPVALRAVWRVSLMTPSCLRRTTLDSGIFAHVRVNTAKRDTVAVTMTDGVSVFELNTLTRNCRSNGMAPPALREHFKRSVGVSPAHYRRTFRRDTA